MPPLPKTQLPSGLSPGKLLETTLLAAKTSPGIRLDRLFSKPGISPYDDIQWENRIASITDACGKSIFRAEGCRSSRRLVDDGDEHCGQQVPAWPDGDTDERETGVRQLVGRVAETVRDWGIKGDYFATPEDAQPFSTTSWSHLLVTQKAAFNSPVWFNVGCDRLEPNSDAQNWHWNPHTCAVEFSVTGYRNPQCSACFINAV